MSGKRRPAGPEAEGHVLAGTRDEKPWVREVAARTLGSFKGDSSLGPKLTALATDDPAYRARTAALISLAEIKAPNAFDVLVAAVNSDSPDDMLRNAALDGFGKLGDERAMVKAGPMEWLAHDRCVFEQLGEGILNLPKEERAKFTLAAVGPDIMQRLIAP